MQLISKILSRVLYSLNPDVNLTILFFYHGCWSLAKLKKKKKVLKAGSLGGAAESSDKEGASLFLRPRFFL